MREAALAQALEKDLPESVGPVFFRKIGPRYLLTNDAGSHLWLEQDPFLSFLRGELEKETPLWNDLAAGGFLGNYMNFEVLGGRWRQRTKYLQEGAGLHLVALTRRNSQGSPYAARPAAGLDDHQFDMTLALARRLAKFIFDSPSSEITLELRGGDPLLNWDVLTFLARHASSFAGSVKRKLRIAAVSPLASLTDEQAAFLAEFKIAVAVPFDGPRDLHDSLRPDLEGGSGWERTLAGVARLRKAGVEPEGFFTVTRGALGRAPDVIAAYRDAGFDAIRVRAPWPAGDARSRWKEIGVGAAAYSEFYRELLDGVLALEAQGIPFREKGAASLLGKILLGTDCGAVEHRLLYGGGLGELAYDYNGDVYPSDEARALASADGDALFRMGSTDLGFANLVGHPTVRALAVASDLGGQPTCSRCAYKPYCGVSPVYNRAAQGSLQGRNPTNDRCGSYLGTFDALFERLRDEKTKTVFERWARAEEYRQGEPLPPFLSGGLL
ncbi:MAG: hypothetical protein CO113_17860 [Elusimicrobia bacterium CG_4_9_14_3_um_filter_62_55]|nr:MAG: hypothetical protein COR54_16320 [Elusimicrobia bacterium CG22_combo_CG10-13_8_21_14_all_63_91]PJA18181.1 MAG: hypothetical protein COX66_02100 [Elusimicrobia bacterium CG_4_10_14_0_2_um_filter_63_34]PJB23551.1 MAG: hypothetical protein CO113_17860 [Elusimicrobia bacterium CG_4_9_14_3_um_filter_62_55]